MTSLAGCPTCGGALLGGRCLACDTRRWSRLVHRETVRLLLLAAIAAGAYSLTQVVAHGDEQLRRRQADAWFARGQQALDDGRFGDALVALRRAALKDPRRAEYRRSLATALIGSGREEEARRLLLDLRTTNPEDPDTNVQLARLAAGVDVDVARRYYENALAALWRPEDAARRRRLQFELIDVLLGRHQDGRALAQLLMLTATMPQGIAGLDVDVGQRYLQAGEPGRALDHFARALRVDRANRAALIGAGEAAFAAGDYARAVRYLDTLPDRGKRLDALRDTARFVQTEDPLAARLSAAERQRRLRRAFEQASATLEACSATMPTAADPFQPLRQRLGAFEDTRRRRRPAIETIEAGLDLVMRIEDAVAARCPTRLTPRDDALRIIGRRHGLEAS